MRLYLEEFEAECGADVGIEGADHHHIAHVMRCKVGDALYFFSPEKGEWEARIVDMNRRTVTCRLFKQVKPPLAPAPSVHLAIARLRPDAWGWMLEKATELGVTHVHPIVSDRVQGGSTWQPHKWNLLMKGAAQQCERLDIPKLFQPTPLHTFIKNIHQNITWLAAMERAEAPHLSQVPFSGEVGFLIGPEGGFSDVEKRMIDACAFIKTVTLGTNILRAETAALYALSLWSSK